MGKQKQGDNQTASLAPGLITLGEAAKGTPYSAEYLSLRARQGKIKAEKFGKTWFVKPEWVREYLVSVKDTSSKLNTPAPKLSKPMLSRPAPEVARPFGSGDKGQGPGRQSQGNFGSGTLLSLSGAARHSPYSPSYLALRVRQGTLRAQKIGRNWYTTRDWLKDYIRAHAAEEKLRLAVYRNFDFGFEQVLRSAEFFISDLASGAKEARAAAGQAFKHKYAPKVLAVVLAATALFVFVAPPAAWAHYGAELTAQMGRTVAAVAKVSGKTTKKALARAGRTYAAANDKLGLPGRAVAAKIKTTAMAVAGAVETPLRELTAASKGSLADARNNIYNSIVNGYDKVAAVFGGERGRVAGESASSADRSVASQPSLSRTTPYPLLGEEGISETLANAFSPFKEAVDFINPLSNDSLAARLSGQVIEAGATIARVDAVSGLSRMVTNFKGALDEVKILQPAGSFLARLGMTSTPPPTPSSERRGLEISGEVNVQPAAQGTTEVAAPQTGATVSAAQDETGATELRGTNQEGETKFRVARSAPTLTLPSPLKGEGTLAQTLKGEGTKSPHPSLSKEGMPLTVSKLVANGDAILSANLSVKGAARLYDALTVNGAVTLNDTLTVAKTIQAVNGLVSNLAVQTRELVVGGGGARISGPLTVAALVAGPTTTETLTVNDGLTVKGASTFIGAGTFNTLAAGTLTVSGDFITRGKFVPQSISSEGAISGRSLTGSYGSFDQLATRNASFGGGASDLFSVRGTSNFSAPLTVASTANITGAVTMGSTMGVTGAASLASTLDVTGAATLNSTLHVVGAVTFDTVSTLKGASDIVTTSTRALIVRDEVGDTWVVDTVADRVILSSQSTSSPAFTLTQSGQALALSISQTSILSTTTAEITAATSTALSLISQSGSASTTLAIYQQGVGAALAAQSNNATSTVSITQLGSGNLMDLYSGSANLLTFRSSGRLGIGTTSPAALLAAQGNSYVSGASFFGGAITATSTLSLLSAVSPQLTFGYDSSNYYTTAISSTGRVSFNAFGGSSADFTYLDNVIIATTTTTQFATGYDTSNYLAIQTNANGTTTLDVIGGQYASLIVSDPIRVATSSLFAFEVRDASGSQLITADTANLRLGISTTTPGAKLAVAGNALFDGAITSYGNLTIPYLTATSTTATSTFAGFIDVNGTGTNATSSFASNLSIGGTLKVGSGSSYLTSAGLNFSTTGSITTQTGALTLQPASDQNLALTVTGAGILAVTNTATSTFSGPLAVMTDKFVVQQTTGNVGIGTTSPSQTLAVQGNAYISGATFFGGAITGTSTLAIQSTTANQFRLAYDAANYANFSIDSSGNLAIDVTGGSISLASGDDLLAAGASSNIGSSGTRFNTIYADTVDATSLAGTVVTGSTSATDWTINSANATNDTVAMSLAFERGNITPNAVLSWDIASKRFDFNFQAEITTTSPALVLDSSTAGDTDFWAGVIADQGGTSNDFFRIGSGTTVGSNNFLTIDSSGFVGIGSTSPWGLLSVNPNGIGAGPEFVIGSSTATHLLVTNAGLVGIGTTSPATLFSVAGQCVTGDTRLRRRRKKKMLKRVQHDGGDGDDPPDSKNPLLSNLSPEAPRSLGVGWAKGEEGPGVVSGSSPTTPFPLLKEEGIPDDYIYDEVQIKDINPGDEILTLDETTGKLVYARVNALMDMGVKPIYTLTTASGKQIRTTGNHPYFIKTKTNRLAIDTNFLLVRFFDCLARAARIFYFNVLTKSSVKVAAFAQEEVKFSRLGWEHLAHSRVRSKLNLLSRFLALPKIIGLLSCEQIHPTYRKQGQEEFWSFQGIVDDVLTKAVVRAINGGQKHFYSVVWQGEQKNQPEFEPTFAEHAFDENANGAVSRLYPRCRGMVTPQLHKQYSAFAAELSSFMPTVVDKAISALPMLSLIDKFDPAEGEWVKASELQPGTKIAIASKDSASALWDIIVKIERTESEPVYDIEVEGTHNFVGNDIVAHNTYITGGLGAGVVETGAGNITGTGRLAIQSATATSTFSTGGLTVGTSQFVVQQTSGNIGIGTSSPWGLLAVEQGSGENVFVVSDQGTSSPSLIVKGSGNIGIGTTSPWGLLSVNPNGIGAGPEFVIGSSTTTHLLVTNAGLVGIGTTSPATLFSVAGQCVTGDTRLRRRRKKKMLKRVQHDGGDGDDPPDSKNPLLFNLSPEAPPFAKGGAKGEEGPGVVDEYIYDEVAIRDINPGDEILTLDETTGKLVYARVNALMDMGVKPIYKLTTESGKTIRTTGNHPYFARAWEAKQSRPRIAVFIDAANLEISVKRLGFKIHYKNLKRIIESIGQLAYIGYFTVSTTAKHNIDLRNSLLRFGYNLVAKPLKLIKDRRGLQRKADVDVEITTEALERKDEFDMMILFSGDSDFYYPIQRLREKYGKKVAVISSKYNVSRELLKAADKYLDIKKFKPELARNGQQKSPSFSTGESPFGNSSLATAISIIAEGAGLSRAAGGGVWTKVKFLRIGQEIAVSAKDYRKAMWDKIINIEQLPAEQVYDIEVEGTHNFVGNDIVAHNTYITGGLGAGAVETTAGNITGTGRLAIQSTTATSTFSTGGLTVGTSQFVVQQTSGNIGIGTTSPWGLLSVNPNGIGAGPEFVIGSSTTTHLLVTNAGLVGIGTTSPATLFSVAGQCVTGDTRLRRRRKKKMLKRVQHDGGDGDDPPDDDGLTTPTPPCKGGDEYDYDEAQIKDINPGDEILTLDETTGKLVYARVNALMDMGIKPIYKLTTASGRSIRTTGNHPYLTPAGWQKAEELAVGAFIAAPKERAKITYAFIDASNIIYGAKDNGWKMDFAKLSRYLKTRFGAERIFYYAGVDNHNKKQLEFYNKLRSFGYELRLNPLKTFVNAKGGFYQKADTDARMAFEAMKHENEYDRAVFLTGDGDFYWLFERLFAKKETYLLAHNRRTARELKKLAKARFTDMENLRKYMAFSGKKRTDSFEPVLGAADAFEESAAGIMASSYTDKEILSSGSVDKASDVFWDRIIEIEHLPAEQVYDIEVEGTHNFVGNDIVAHNTYITGGFGAGAVETTAGNITGTGRLAIQSTTATSTFSTGGLTVGTSQFVVQQTSGNIGIGTTSPSQLLSVQGNVLISGNLNSMASLTATGTIAFNSAARTTGSTPLLSLTAGADTGLTAATEATDVQFNLGRTKTHANGIITLQRDFLINAPTHAFTTYSTGNSITDLATLGITGAPITALTGNATTTNAHTLYLGASSLNASTTNSYGLTVNANTGATNNYAAMFLGGNVGIGTTSPAQLLSIAGQCVTGDTKLRRRRRKQKKPALTGDGGDDNDDGYIYDQVAIKDIQVGDEILTLDENTGQLVYARVNALMDMGVKQTFMILTGSGKQIRTTANHPYFVKQESAGDLNWLQKESFAQTEKTARAYYFGNLAGRSIFSQALNDDIHFTEEGWNHFVIKNRSLNEIITRFFALPRAPFVLARPTAVIRYNKREKPGKTIEYWELRQIIDHVLVRVIVSAINGGPKFFLTAVWLGTKPEKGIQPNQKGLSLSPPLPKAEWGRRRRMVTSQPYKASISRKEKMSSANGLWIKAENLEPGVKIATIDGWEAVVAITPVAEEPVYDIEVAGTHNFVGNDIIAHNTYITGGFGAGVVETAAGNITGTGRLAIQSTTATSTFSTGGLTVGTSQFVVQQTSGNIGIGSTTPNWIFSVNGAGSGFAVNSSGAVVQGSWTGTSIADAYLDNNITLAAGTISGASNVMSLGSDAAGDIYYRNSSTNLTRLGIGTGGYILGVSSGLPAWLATSTIGVQGRGNGAANQIAYWSDANTITSSSNFLWNNTANLLTVTGNATTTQLTTTNNTYLATTGGNVGIGTTGPGTLLDVAGNIRGQSLISTGATNQYIDIDRSLVSRHGSVRFFTNAVEKWSVGMTDSDLVGDGSEFYIGQTIGGTSASMVIKTDGNVGIGTTGPGALLDVYGSLGSTRISGNQVTHIYNAEANPRWQIDRDAGGSGLVGIKFGAGGASTLDTTIARISGGGLSITGGNVGIGTTAPGSPLDVSISDATTNAVTNVLELEHVTTGTPAAGLGAGIVFKGENAAGAGLTLANIDAIVTQATANDEQTAITFKTANYDVVSEYLERMRIQHNGNVGIGTTTPNQKLSIFNSAADSAIEFSSAAGDAYKWTMGMDYSDAGKFKIASSTALGTSDRFVIDGNGNVGIGTTGPSEKLQVVGGNIRTASNVYGGNIYAANGGIIGVEAGSLVLDSQSGGDIIFRPATSEKVRITSTGNVGIGTTTPGQQLQIYKALATEARMSLKHLNVAGNTYYEGQIAQSTNDLVIDSVGDSLRDSGTGTGSLLFRTRSGNVGANTIVDAVKITSGGNVGIGTAAPGELLTVAKSGGNHAIRLQDTGQTNRYVDLEYVTSAGSEAQFAIKTTAGGAETTDFFIDNAGNVGIGTTAPVEKLQVNGAIKVTGTVVGATGTGLELAWDGSRSFLNSYNRTAGTYQRLDINDFVSFVGGSTSGNVGIGTTTPWGLLSVNANGIGSGPQFVIGSSTKTDLIVTNNGNVGIGTTGPGAKLDVNGAFIARSAGSHAIGGAANTNIAMYITGQYGGNSGEGTYVGTYFGQTIERKGSAGRPLTGVQISPSFITGGVVEPSSTLWGLAISPGTITPGGGTTVNTATVYIGDAYTATVSGSNYALWSDAGTNRFDGTTLLAIDGGNVGIGTSTPNQKLSIFNSAADSAIEFSSASGDAYKWTMGLDYTDGSFRIASSTALGTSDRFVINGNGNVGIGTTTPWGLLSVNANGIGSGPQFVIGSSTKTDLIVTNNGSVGIGTTGPSTALQVVGTATATAFSGPLTGNVTGNVSGSAGSVPWTGVTTGKRTDYVLGFQAPASAYAGFEWFGTNAASAGYFLIRGTSDSDVYTAEGITLVADQGAITLAGRTTTNGAGYLRFMTPNSGGTATERMRILATSGNVGIGTTSPWRTLSVAGTVGFNSSLGTGVGGNYLCIDTNTYEVLRGNGSACTASSIRFKENVQDLNYGLAEVLGLRPVSYNYKPETNMGDGTKLGFIAEEMRSVLPEVVTLDKDGNAFGIDYPVLTAALTGAIQELYSNVRAIVTDASGNIALGDIGATTGSLSVNLPHCVTADTLLAVRRRRRKKRPSADIEEPDVEPSQSDRSLAAKRQGNVGSGAYDYLLMPIVQVQVGDEVLSLNESTGAVEYHRVNALMDMGAQEVYELVTRSGRRIRTTSEHPYLVRG